MDYTINIIFIPRRHVMSFTSKTRGNNLKALN